MRYPIGATWLCLLLSACAGDGKDENVERDGDLREYRVSIDGSCPQPIPSLIPEVGPLTLDAFSFTLNFFWEQPIIPSM